MGSHRLFVGIELDARWRRWLVDVAARLRRCDPGEFRWVSPEVLHLTIVFLGAQPSSSLPRIRAAVCAAASRSPPCQLRPGKTGTFGGRSPRVIWVAAVDAQAGLERLRSAVGSELDAARVSYDPKPLVAHITLARARRGQPSRAEWLAEGLSEATSPPPPPPLGVSHLTLFESQLLSSGPRYTVLERAMLAGPEHPSSP